MFIATKIWFDPETFLPVVWDGWEYEGPVNLAKKGRETAADLTSELQGLSKTLTGNGQTSYNAAQGILGEGIGSSKPGSLTPAATAQLASDNDNIARTYGTMRQTAAATAGQRGYGSAPSGFEKTTENGISNAEAGAQTGAYRNAQENTQNERNLALSGETALSGQQTGAGLSAAGGALTGAVDQNKMGSTAGDILQGAAGFTGALPGIGGLFSKIGKTVGGGSSVGGYGSFNGGVS